tara:strand:+ start:894 stop:1550 length:657 start_codon:yes stop_codon:yes gene_type:complete
MSVDNIVLKSKSDTLIVFSLGWYGPLVGYLDNLINPLSLDFNVAALQQNFKGNEYVDFLAYKFAEFDEQARSETNPSKVIYMGHSMGAAIAARAHTKYNTSIDGFYGINAYPKYSVTKKGVFEKTIGLFDSINFGPLLTLDEVDAPSEFAIATNDEVLKTFDEEVRAELMNELIQRGSIVLFPDRTHCFNEQHNDYAPFNKVNSNDLVYAVKNFINKI